MLCALAQVGPLLHTPLPTSPEPATVPPATRCQRLLVLLHTGRRWPARCAPPRLKASPSTAGRECGSADSSLDVPRVVALLLLPGSHPPHAVRLPFHTDQRNPARAMPHQNTCG